MTKEKSKIGRPTKATEAKKKKALELAAEGKTNKQIAKFLKVAERSLLNWRLDDEEFLLAMRHNKEIADETVENALYVKATGFQKEIKKETVYYGKKINYVERTYYPPDHNAALHWLKNRQPKKWRDKQEVELSNPDGNLKAVVILPDNGKQAQEESIANEGIEDDKK